MRKHADPGNTEMLAPGEGEVAEYTGCRWNTTSLSTSSLLCILLCRTSLWVLRSAVHVLSFLLDTHNNIEDAYNFLSKYKRHLTLLKSISPPPYLPPSFSLPPPSSPLPSLLPCSGIPFPTLVLWRSQRRNSDSEDSSRNSFCWQGSTVGNGGLSTLQNLP